jgi:hypothetical protein
VRGSPGLAPTHFAAVGSARHGDPWPCTPEDIARTGMTNRGQAPRIARDREVKRTRNSLTTLSACGPNPDVADLSFDDLVGKQG